jgi:hypothetical protein
MYGHPLAGRVVFLLPASSLGMSKYLSNSYSILGSLYLLKFCSVATPSIPIMLLFPS